MMRKKMFLPLILSAAVLSACGASTAQPAETTQTEAAQTEAPVTQDTARESGGADTESTPEDGEAVEAVPGGEADENLPEGAIPQAVEASAEGSPAAVPAAEPAAAPADAGEPKAAVGETEDTAEAPSGVAVMQSEDAQRKAEEEKLLAQEKKTGRDLMIRYGLIFGGGVFLTVWVVFMIIFAIAHKPLTAEGSVAGTIFWIVLCVLSLGGGAAAGWFGVRRAKDHAEKIAEYHRTPFYEGFREEVGKMDENTQWCYKIYRSLERTYMPVPLFSEPEKDALENYHGVLYSGWTFKTSRDTAEPQFVIATKKAIYIVRTLYLKGRMEGGLEDAEWITRQDADAEGGEEAKGAVTGRILNMVEENDMNLRTVRSQLQLTSPLPIESIPFYNVLMFSTDTVIRALRIAQAGENVIVCQGGPDRLRSVISMHESRLENHEVALDDLMDVFEEIRKKRG